MGAEFGAVLGAIRCVRGNPFPPNGTEVLRDSLGLALPVKISREIYRKSDPSNRHRRLSAQGQFKTAYTIVARWQTAPFRTHEAFQAKLLRRCAATGWRGRSLLFISLRKL